MGLATFCVSVAMAQPKQIKMEPVRPTMAQTGAEFFSEFCAVCHGPDGKGGGPAAGALKAKPTDLTQIKRQHNNKFPTIDVRSSITSGAVAAHGTSEMPMWGDAFKSISANQSAAEIRINNIVSFIEKMQQ